MLLKNKSISKVRFDEINQKKKELEWQVMYQKSQIDEMRGNGLINHKRKEEMLKLYWLARIRGKKRRSIENYSYIHCY